MTGVAIGKIFVPHLAWFLQQEYGYLGGILVYGAIILNCCTAAMVFRIPPILPLNDGKQNCCYDSDTSVMSDVDSCNYKTSAKSMHTPLIANKPIGIFRSIWNKLKESFKALYSYKVLINGIAIASFMMSYNNFTMLIPYSMTRRGFTYSEAAWALSYSAFSNAATRATMSLLADREWFNVKIVYMTGASIAGVSCCSKYIENIIN